jgi:hypothetical protein
MLATSVPANFIQSPRSGYSGLRTDGQANDVVRVRIQCGSCVNGGEGVCQK